MTEITEEKRVQEDLFSLVKKLADLVETSVVVTITGLSLRMEDEWRKVFLEPGGATAGKHLSATLKLCASPNKPGVSYECEIDVDPDFCGVLETGLGTLERSE